MKLFRNNDGTPRWHLVYFALAGFDLLTILFSLTLTHNLMTMYSRSVESNRVWAERIGSISQMGDFAQAVNAPGNDVFDTQDVTSARADRDAALLLFGSRIAEVRSNLGNGATAEERVKMSRLLDVTQVAMDDMVAEADQIFHFLEAADPVAAATKMASMDRAYARVTRSISDTVRVVQTIQSSRLDTQISTAKRLQWLELVVACLVVLMVIGVTLYGHFLSRLMQRQAAALKKSEDAEQASQTKSIFLANMSHELRTPLNGILGMAQVVSMNELSVEQRTRVDVIQSSGAALLAILNDILDLAKIQAGKFDLSLATFNSAELATVVAHAFRGAAEIRGIDLIVDVEAGVPGDWIGDSHRLRQVLSNLVGNAIKFTSTGWVRIEVAGAAGGPVFRVRDTGTGIGPGQISSLFEQFTQADGDAPHQYGGTGLGLSISRELVDLMGGAIEVQSEVGVGSCFTVTIPLEMSEPAAAVHVFSPAAGDDPLASSPGLRILAAEDNPTNVLVLRAFLGSLSAEVTVVSNGREAVEAFTRQTFDIVLMDVQMPEMNGVDATRAIRELERADARTPTPIIALTANVMSHQTAHYLAAGMNNFVAKPIDLTSLFNVMDKALNSDSDAEADRPVATRHEGEWHCEDIHPQATSRKRTF